MKAKTNSNDLQEILSQAIDEMKMEQGEKFNLSKINLAELERRTGLSRSKLRHLKENNFIVTPHGRTGMKAATTVLTGYTGVIDGLLRKAVTNSVVCYERIREAGYSGSLTSVKDYIASHQNLVPAKREAAAPQASRGRRYSTAPGESYQMDWGFVNVETTTGTFYRAACFAMVCHHCGERYIEFFPNAKQENLFIGMPHAFVFMGVPESVLTDNMKSVVIQRDGQGHPIWQKDYGAFMKTVGFKTKLCRPRHPFTKGAAGRLVRFVKENFLPGRAVSSITELNYQAVRRCNGQNSIYHRAVDCVPDARHHKACMQTARPLVVTDGLFFYP